MKIETMSLINAIKGSKKVKGDVMGYNIIEGSLVKQFKDGRQYVAALTGENFIDISISEENLKLIEKIKEFELNFNLNNKQIETSKRKIKLNDAGEIYKINNNSMFSYDEKIQCSIEEFKQLTQTIDYTATDETRPILKGVNFKKNKVCALDGYTLGLREGSFNLEGSYTVPGELLKAAVSLIDKFTKEIIIYFTDREITIQTGEKKIIGLLLEGDYIKYESLINDYNKTTIEFKKEEIKEEIDFILSGAAEKKIIIIEKENDDIKLKDNSAEGIEIEIEAESTGENIKIAFNPKYLKTAIKNHGEKIKFYLNNSVSACIVKSKEIKGLDLVLPVRLY